jgi:tetratricopeptide (TPR) repeat protein
MNDASSTDPLDLDLQWDPLDPTLSEEKFRHFLHQSRTQGSPDPGREIELWCLIARAQAEQKNLSAARISLKEAERLLGENPNLASATAKIRWLLECGRLSLLQKSPTHARSFLADAWQLATKAQEDFFAIDVAQMMAGLETPKMQQEWVLRAIRMAEESSQPKAKRWLGSLYSNLGWKLFDHLQLEKSLQFFEKALTNYQKYGSAHDIFVTQWSIGRVYRKMNRTQEALDLQKQLLDTKSPTPLPMGRLYQEIAECLQALQRPTEAQPYFELAYQALQQDQWVQDNQSEDLQRLKSMGKVKDRTHQS